VNRGPSCANRGERNVGSAATSTTPINNMAVPAQNIGIVL
jgi:hypothetical protein